MHYYFLSIWLNLSYHKLKPAGWVVSLKSIPTVTAIVAPGPSDATQRNKIIALVITSYPVFMEVVTFDCIKTAIYFSLTLYLMIVP